MDRSDFANELLTQTLEGYSQLGLERATPGLRRELTEVILEAATVVCQSHGIRRIA